MKKLTPNLIVERIEDSLPFWTALGFEKKVDMMEGDRVAKDVPPLADAAYRSTLYIEVDDLAPIRRALAAVKPVVPERTTSWDITASAGGRR